MDFRIGVNAPCGVEYGVQESDAVKIAAENLKTDLVKVFGGSVLAETQEKGTEIRIRTLEGCMEQAKSECPIEEEIYDQWYKKLQDERGVLRKEAYSLCVKDGVLFIIGADRRGTVYGIYELCQRIGVSPWYFWADVPVRKKEEYMLPADYEYIDYPSVEYRGIFINDEEELEAWAKSYMSEDTIGVRTYEKIFELLLRLKGNYIWPAMHVNSFNVKRENGALADKMGIVVGTSHCDMLMRSNNREWNPWISGKGYEGVKYDYSIPGKNREILQEYWRESVEQNSEFEVCYTLGMRGIHDSGFETEGLQGLEGEELKTAKIRLLQKVVSDQQQILKDTLGRDTMMTFIPYKEVLPLYDGGLEIPEEITLVWSNDNYGYIRRYPSEKEKNRKGGNGIYYHNSYWAPPGMSYVFLCSIPLAHTANELRKAYAEGVRKLWVINTGAMKPLEQEIEFFLRLGWDIGKEDALTDDVDAYVENWINRNFTGNIGRETAALLNDFSQITNMRKLEMMDYDAFSQTAYGDEAAVRIHIYEELFRQGNRLYASLPEEEREAFFQLVLMRIHGAYFTNLAYYYGDRSTLAYHQGKLQAAGEYVKQVRALEDARRRMLIYYNRKMVKGKWNHILDPEGFPPPRAAMMPICTPPLNMGHGGMTVTIWNEDKPIYTSGCSEEEQAHARGELIFTRQKVKWLEIGNTGTGSIAYVIEAPEWLKLSQVRGTVQTECRILVWPEDTASDRQGEIIVTENCTGSRVKITVRTIALLDAIEEWGGKQKSQEEKNQYIVPEREADREIWPGAVHVEDDGMIAVKADCADSPCFKKIVRLGRGYGNLMEACEAGGFGDAKSGRVDGEVDQASFKHNGPLRYWVFFLSAGEFMLEIQRFPSLNSTGRIRIGVSVDDGPVQIVETEANDEHRGTWRENVRNNVDRMYLKLPYLEKGGHVISFYAIDLYAAFSGFVIYTKERKDNNFAGAEGCQALPEAFDAESFAKTFYGSIPLEPRAVEYACPEKETDTLAVTDIVMQENAYGETVEPDWILRRGEEIFSERNGYICIDCASALAQSANSYTMGQYWEHCASESYGRSGMALYIRKRDISKNSKVHSLNYRFQCTGGMYVVWLFAKFGGKEESFFGVGIDGCPLKEEEIYRQGCLWRYEAEQIYRYVPVGRIKLQEGNHLLTFYAKAAGLRFDRICLVSEEEFKDSQQKKLPPADSKWKEFC